VIVPLMPEGVEHLAVETLDIEVESDRSFDAGRR